MIEVKSKEGELSSMSSPESNNLENDEISENRQKVVRANKRREYPHAKHQDDEGSSQSQLSNLTEERDFTPGKKQFKSFLKLQTADRFLKSKRADAKHGMAKK